MCFSNKSKHFWTFWKIRLGLDWISCFPFKDGESALTKKRIFGQKISWPFTWKTWQREWYMSLSFSLMNNWLLLRWFMAIFITRSRTALSEKDSRPETLLFVICVWVYSRSYYREVFCMYLAFWRSTLLA